MRTEKRVYFRQDTCRLNNSSDRDFVCLGPGESVAGILPFDDDVWRFRVIIRCAPEEEP